MSRSCHASAATAIRRGQDSIPENMAIHLWFTPLMHPNGATERNSSMVPIEVLRTMTSFA